MSAESIDVPAVGNVKREYVYAGGALVAGIAGYAWWHARGGSSSGKQLVVNGNDVIPATDRVTPPSGDSNVNVDGTNGKITTNAQWTQFVLDKLAAYGIDPAVASSSLGKWLSRAVGGYTATDVEAIQRAVGVAGYPPEGGPWNIPAVSTPTPNNGGGNGQTMAKPGGLHVNRDAQHGVQVVWDADANTDTYRVEVRRKSDGHLYQINVPGPHGVITTGTYFPSTDTGVVRTVTVIPMNESGEGPSAQIEYTS